MTPLESAARALWELSGRPSKAQDIMPSSVAPESQPDWDRFVPLARAVLEAVREPSDEMAAAGAEIVRNVQVEESEVAFASDAANTWRFMIDAAIAEK